MRAMELKSNIHSIIDNLESEQLLQSLYDFLKTKKNLRQGDVWTSLTEEQKKEVLLSFDESEEEENLLEREKVFRRTE